MFKLEITQWLLLLGAWANPGDAVVRGALAHAEVDWNAKHGNDGVQAKEFTSDELLAYNDGDVMQAFVAYAIAAMTPPAVDPVPAQG
jgi:hypothetical protein